MKTTKRSKMLLSSIAMLLVALVALGSATFAWYSITRTVYAHETEITASTPGGLQIALASTGTWETEVDLAGMQDTLEPAALAFAANGGVTATYYDGTNQSNGSASSAAKSAVNGIKYWCVDEIWLKNTNSVNGAVKVTATATSDGTLADSYSCIALVDEAGTVAYVAKSAGTTTVSGAVASGTQSSSAITSLTANGANTQHYYVYAWVDGYNANCTNVKSASAGTVSWDLAFTMDDAA